jgi:hypothetical protein
MKAAADDSHQRITGTFFCPKDGMRYPAGVRSCPECGAALIDVSAIMEQSRRNPSNEICAQCHPIGRIVQLGNHSMLDAEKLPMCLDCHKGHDDCGGCHY